MPVRDRGFGSPIDVFFQFKELHLRKRLNHQRGSNFSKHERKQSSLGSDLQHRQYQFNFNFSDWCICDENRRSVEFYHSDCEGFTDSLENRNRESGCIEFFCKGCVGEYPKLTCVKCERVYQLRYGPGAYGFFLSGPL